MKIKKGKMHFHFNSQLLGPNCNWIKVQVPLFLFDIYEDKVEIVPAPRWLGIIHNVQRIIITATRCIISGKVINACCRCY